MLASGQITTKQACPSAEQLAEYVDGGLRSATAQVIEQHLLECSDCRTVVVEASISLEESSTTERKRWTARIFQFSPLSGWPTLRVAVTWTGAIGALAATVFLVVDPINLRRQKLPVPLQSRVTARGVEASLPSGEPSAHSQLAQTAAIDRRIVPSDGRLPTVTTLRNVKTLVAPGLEEAKRALEEAQRESAETALREMPPWVDFREAYQKQFVRLVEGRLIGFAYAQLLEDRPGTARGAGANAVIVRGRSSQPGSAVAVPYLKLAMPSVMKLEDFARSSPDYRGLAATALLATGETPRALDLFEQVKQSGITSAYFLNDLSVAYLASGRIAEALASAEAAIRLNPELSEPYFNRALALEKLAKDSATAWSDAVQHTTDFRWSLEAERHLPQQIQPPSVRK